MSTFVGPQHTSRRTSVDLSLTCTFVNILEATVNPNVAGIVSRWVTHPMWSGGGGLDGMSLLCCPRSVFGHSALLGSSKIKVSCGSSLLPRPCPPHPLRPPSLGQCITTAFEAPKARPKASSTPLRLVQSALAVVHSRALSFSLHENAHDDGKEVMSSAPSLCSSLYNLSFFSSYLAVEVRLIPMLINQAPRQHCCRIVAGP